MTQTITAYYDTRSDAQAAADRLASAGISSSAVTIHDASSTDSTSSTTTDRTEDKGFWASLGDMFMPDEDRYTYSEGIRRGGSVLTVRAESDEFDRVSDILEESGSVDLDSRESQWKSEGWSGYDSSRTSTMRDDSTLGLTAPMDSPGTTTSAYGMDKTATSYGTDRTATSYGTDDASLARSRSDTDLDRDRDGTIDVVEENLRVGKRDVSHGRVKVRSYVVSEDVSQDVNLRNERVDIERRPVDRAVSSTDNAFRDQTLELEETGEEAVVSKEARVKEEIDLKRVAEDRTQTVSDTVRRTEVEIDDERTGRSGTSSSTLTEDEMARRRGA